MKKKVRMSISGYDDTEHTPEEVETLKKRHSSKGSSFLEPPDSKF